jgi:hypothetical protein
VQRFGEHESGKKNAQGKGGEETGRTASGRDYMGDPRGAGCCAPSQLEEKRHGGISTTLLECSELSPEVEISPCPRVTHGNFKIH